jgi:hypothetical protein
MNAATGACEALGKPVALQGMDMEGGSVPNVALAKSGLCRRCVRGMEMEGGRLVLRSRLGEEGPSG